MHYHWLSVLFVLTLAPVAGLATPLAQLWDDRSVKHAWNAVPDNWESLGPPPPGTTIDLYVALQPQNENALIEALYAVSTPRHPKYVLFNTPPRTMYYLCVPLLRCRYGAHLSKEEIAKLVEPHPDTLELVHSWLAHHDIQSSSISTTHGGNWLTVTGVPVSQANELLGASYRLYQHVGTNDTILRTVGYALPTVLHAHVQTVAPTTFFASPRTLWQTPHRHSAEAAEALAKAASKEPVSVLSRREEFEPPSDANGVTPEFLHWLYKTSAYVPAATGKNSLGIAGFGQEYPSYSDLELFMSVFLNGKEDATFSVEEVNGGLFDPSLPGIEANLNVQYTQAMAYPTPHIFYTIGGRIRWSGPYGEPDPSDSTLVWLSYLIHKRIIPRTISLSYGAYEVEMPPEYARGLCYLYAQLGARGVSILFASGDRGVGPGACEDGSGGVQFMPMFPATCMCGVLSLCGQHTNAVASRLPHRHGFVGPYITSVGGTTKSLPEIAAPLSGGGFSNYFLRPEYQDRDVPDFFKRLGGKYKGLYKCVFCRGLFLLCNFVICAALTAAGYPTSHRRRSTS